MAAIRLSTRRLVLVALDAAQQRAAVEDPAALPGLLGAAVPEAWPPEAYTSEAEAHAAERLAREPWLQGWLLWYAVRTGAGPASLAGVLHIDAVPAAAAMEVVPAMLASADDPTLEAEAEVALRAWAAAHGPPGAGGLSVSLK